MSIVIKGGGMVGGRIGVKIDHPTAKVEIEDTQFHGVEQPIIVEEVGELVAKNNEFTNLPSDRPSLENEPKLKGYVAGWSFKKDGNPPQ